MKRNDILRISVHDIVIRFDKKLSQNQAFYIHKCPHCDKKFRDTQGYKEHIKGVHEKNTPFKCDLCPKTYALLPTLKTHIKLVHNRVKCEECGDMFSKKNISRHRKVHLRCMIK